MGVASCALEVAGVEFIEENGGGPPAAAEVRPQLARPFGFDAATGAKDVSQLPPDPNVGAGVLA